MNGDGGADKKDLDEDDDDNLNDDDDKEKLDDDDGDVQAAVPGHPDLCGEVGRAGGTLEVKLHMQHASQLHMHHNMHHIFTCITSSHASQHASHLHHKVSP